MATASYDISLQITKKRKSFSGGEDFIKLSLETVAKHIDNKSIQERILNIQLS
jgi:hypothetical protein